MRAGSCRHQDEGQDLQGRVLRGNTSLVAEMSLVLLLLAATLVGHRFASGVRLRQDSQSLGLCSSYAASCCQETAPPQPVETSHLAALPLVGHLRVFAVGRMVAKVLWYE